MNGQTVQKLPVTTLTFLGVCLLFSSVARAQGEADRAMLLAGKPLSFVESDGKPTHELRAEWIADAIDKGEGIDVTNAKIVGDLTLADRTIQKGVRCTNCEFTGEVDFQRSIVERPLELIGSSFDDEVLMNDSEFRSIVKLDHVNLQRTFSAKSAYFHREFLAKYATFGAEFILSSSKLEGSSDFTGSTFTENAFFQSTDFGSETLFRSVLFQQITSFESAVFEGDARFDRDQNDKITAFEKQADFGWAHFQGFVTFSGVAFDSDVNFYAARLDHIARFDSLPKGAITLFNREANFNSVHFARADFSGARFRGQSNFEFAIFDANANFETDDVNRPTEFADTADFVAAQFLGDANFSNVVFTKDAIFSRAKVVGMAQFDSALPEEGAPITEFKGPVNFTITDFEGQASFASVKFDGAATFRGTRFNAGAFFAPKEKPDVPTVFLSEAEFSLAVFSGRAIFTNVIFERKVSFTTADVDALADFTGANFREVVDFETCRFTSVANFESTQFDGGASFHDASFHVVRFSAKDVNLGINVKGGLISGSGRKGGIHQGLASRWLSSLLAKSPTQFPKGVDFQGASYEWIDNWESPISHLSKFSPEPYVAVENFLRKSGYDTDADNVVLARKASERKALWEQRNIFRWLESWLDKILFNYGVHPYRLAILFGLLIWLGSLFFSLPNTVQLTDQDKSELVSLPTQLSRGQALAFLVGQCIPVETPLTTQWKASDQPVEIRLRLGKSRLIGFSVQPSVVAFSLKLLGWLFVPVGAAALTNLL
jgi:uncharacterized protein YjbI with pentapeptide repeats